MDIEEEERTNLHRASLNADDLMKLRNSTTNLCLQSVGQKKCLPSTDSSESDGNKILLNNHKMLLEQQRAAKVSDLIQAEWDENLQKSITKKLKGKFTRHMGHSSSGNITLSPEETIFLVENGLLELTRGGAPMSTEEAYAIVLSGQRSIEKYQVYCHLSRLGYLVVTHVEKDEEVNDVNHGDVSLKRKRVDNDEDEEEENDDEDEDVDVEEHDDSLESVPKKLHINGNESYNDIPNSDIDDSQPLALLTTPANLNRSNSTTTDGTSRPVPVTNHISVPLSSDYQKPIDATMPSKVVNEDSNISPSRRLSNSESEEEEEDNDDDEAEEVKNETVDEEADNEDEEEEDVTVETEQSRLPFTTVGSNSIEIATKVSQCFIVAEDVEVSEEEEEDSDENDKEQQEEDDSNTDESSSDDSAVVENSTVTVDTDTVSCDNEDEIVLVQVTKKEKQPLAVIDLLSDEGSSDKEKADQEDDDDDEIQIIGECKRTSTSKPQHIKLKKEGSSLKLKQETYPDGRNSVLWKFPSLLKKSVICLPRPPAHLLPLNVCLSKEVYTMDMKMILANSNINHKPRVWNSYRDLQERKRNHQSNSGHSSRSSSHIPPFLPNLGASPEYNGNGVQSSYGGDWMGQHQSFGPPSQSGLFRNGQPMNYNQYIEHARQTAMHVAQTVMNQMTRNLPFPAPNLLPLPAHQPQPSICSRPNSMYTTVPDQSAFQVLEGRHGHPYEAHRHMDRSLPALEDALSCGRPTYPSSSNEGSQRSGWSHTELPYPSSIPKVQGRQESWRDFKSAAGWEKPKSDDEDDILEVPIDVDQVLWSATISPLVQPGLHDPLEIAKCLQITQSANLIKGSSNNRYGLRTSLEISFDVYLPGTSYKKSCPPVPNYRIVVMCAKDPFPKESEIVCLQKKFTDSATLQFGVVSGSDISFYSFNHIDLPSLPLVIR